MTDITESNSFTLPSAPEYYIREGDSPPEPMDAARAFRDLKRERKLIKARDAVLSSQEQMLDELIKRYQESGLLPIKIPLKGQGGGTVFQRHDVWARVREGVSEQEMVELFQKHSLDYTIKTAPNTHTLSAYIRGELSDDESKTAEERLAENGFPSELLAILDVSDKYTTSANGL